MDVIGPSQIRRTAIGSLQGKTSQVPCLCLLVKLRQQSRIRVERIAQLRKLILRHALLPCELGKCCFELGTRACHMFALP
ncbi:hypothetical protein XHV734_1345 [Xanthomonas hortorum pv. vitians]|nr:hypothetical protein XHV734_1345 [Xanthomonas hortorum pv. vitians]